MSEAEASYRARPPGPNSSGGELQVLATEHWSLLASRSLTYAESFSRISTFLLLISGATVALALFAQVDRFGFGFRIAAIPILAILLLTGISTTTRLLELNRDDIRWVIGMNRLRRAYTDMYPGIKPFLVTSTEDDMDGVFRTMGLDAIVSGSRGARFMHGFSTLPVLMAALDGLVGGALVGVVAATAGAGLVQGVSGAIASGLILFGLLGAYGGISFRRFARSLQR